VVIGDSELGGDVVEAFACMTQNWRNTVIQFNPNMEYTNDNEEKVLLCLLQARFM
jgi:hypothetical protein